MMITSILVFLKLCEIHKSEPEKKIENLEKRV